MSESSICIEGVFQEGKAGRFAVINPATEEEVGQAGEASVEQVRSAGESAAAAFPAWSQTSAEERSRCLQAAGDAIREAFDSLLPVVIAETGCTEVVGRQMQIPVAASRFDAYARYALDSPVLPLPPQETAATPLAPGGVIGALARRQPVGVVGCITPYNFPIVSLAGKLGPALAMGNTAVVRPAPQDPLAVVAVVRLLQEILPPGVVNLVTGSTAETGEALVESPEVDMISFTGSSSVGRRIAEVGGRTMKRLLLELGGKGAALVLVDADLASAIRMIGSTWTFHSGQICTAPTRAIVHRSVYDAVVEGLVQMGGALPIGDPHDAKTVVGPVISEAQRDRIEGHYASARSEGAEILLGGERPSSPSRGFYAAPSLIAASPDMQIAQEEIFGPAIVVMPFDDEEEGVAIANGTSYGLYDYVFSGDTARAMEISRQLRAGNVGLNTTQRNHETPFGGTKQSGLGRDGGVFGLHAYSELQSVVWPS